MKEKLKSIQEKERAIKLKEEKMSILRQLSSCVGSNAYDDMPKNPNKGQSRTEKMVLRILSLEQEIAEDRIKLEKDQYELMNLIEQIDDLNIQYVLIGRYFKRMKWQEIATSLNYTKRRVYQMHDEGIAMLDDIFK